MRPLECRLLGFVLALLIAGCVGMVPAESGDIVSGGPFPIIERQVYKADAPSAVMTLADSSTGAKRGTIRGIIHGWPFAHTDPSGDFGEGLFSYQIDFVATSKAPENPRLPGHARGKRTVYFHPDREPISLGDAAAFSAGQPIITDSVEISFSFDSTGSNVELTTIMRQTSAQPFTWNDQTVTPPQTGEQSAEASGAYSAQLGGYVFTSAM
ncbi:MAG: hypothetical protein WA740_05740 [Candidatus Binataceae bacterium]